MGRQSDIELSKVRVEAKVKAKGFCSVERSQWLLLLLLLNVSGYWLTVVVVLSFLHCCVLCAVRSLSFERKPY